MSKKRVYAALEIADREVRLLVFEIFDGRENILRVERAGHSGLKNQKIENEASVVKAINEALANAQAALGYRIERVLLAVPSLNVKTNRSKVRVQTEEGAHSIRLFHIQQGFSTAAHKTISDDVAMVNATRILYEIDGETSSKLPVSREADEFIMDVESVYASKDAIYSYGRAVEQSNLEILDVFLDSYAGALETGAMALSEDRPIIQLLLEADHTTLTFFMKGRMLHSAQIPDGYMSFIQTLQEKYGLDDEISFRLLQNLFSDREEDNPDSAIYIDQKEDERIEITARELYDTVLPEVKKWIESINKGCEPLLASGNVRYILSGQGADIPVFRQLLDSFNANAVVYQPTLIGARDNALSDVLGLGYAFQNQNRITHNDKISVGNNELEASLESIKKKSGADEGNFTRKMKSVILGTNS